MDPHINSFPDNPGLLPLVSRQRRSGALPRSGSVGSRFQSAQDRTERNAKRMTSKCVHLGGDSK